MYKVFRVIPWQQNIVSEKHCYLNTKTIKILLDIWMLMV